MIYRDKILKYILVFILLWLYILVYNFWLITKSIWIFHPDEQYTHLFVETLKNNWNLYLDKWNHLNKIVWHNIFWSPFMIVNSENIWLPIKPYWEYYLIWTIDSIIWNIYYFQAIIGLINLIWLLFFYLIIKKILWFNWIRSFYTALVIFILPTTIFWSNMYYLNSIAFSIFIVGLYYLLANKDKISYKIIWWILFSLSIFIRYEYLLILLLLLIFNLKLGIKKFKIVFLIIFILILGIWYLNNKYYWWPLNISYTSSNNLPSTVGKEVINNEWKLLKWIKNIYHRFFEKDSKPDLKRLKKNINENLNNYLYFLYIISIIGIFKFTLKANKTENKKIFLITTAILIYWSYNNLAWFHWGEWQWYNFNVHSRYIYWLYFFLIFYLFYCIKWVGKEKILTLLIIALIITITNSKIFNWKWSLIQFSESKKFSYQINDKIKSNDVFIWNNYEIYITEWYIIPYDRIDKLWIDRILNDLKKLRSLWLISDIYIWENKRHKPSYKWYAEKFYSLSKEINLKIIIIN